MSYLRELNKTSKMQQGLFFFSPPLLDFTFLYSKKEHIVHFQRRIFIFNVAQLFFIILHSVLCKVGRIDQNSSS